VQSFYNRLFRKKKSLKSSPSESVSNVESHQAINLNPNIINAEGSIQSPPSTILRLETPQIIVGVAQSAGFQRDQNEDAILTFTTNLISNDKSFNLGLYIVADGMGGHENGELASSMAVRMLASHVINTFYMPALSSMDNHMDTSIQEVMQTGIMDAHQSIRDKALGSGTTLTAALVLGDLMTIAHVGDSRAYSIDHDGYLQLLTHDHSLVKRLEEIGQITPDEASIHPSRNLLYRALGQGEPFKPDITSLQVCRGCELLLCSDGLWGVVSEHDISEILRSSPTPQYACQSLINAANAAGGPDNISVILVRFPE
jgi:serine/threonine protein phosphatase PrpC